MTEREKDAAFKEGFWTGRLDVLLNRSSGHAAMWVCVMRTDTSPYHYSHGYVIGVRDALLEPIAAATIVSLEAPVTKESGSIG